MHPSATDLSCDQSQTEVGSYIREGREREGRGRGEGREEERGWAREGRERREGGEEERGWAREGRRRGGGEREGKYGTSRCTHSLDNSHAF